jgi:hypothetical protein
MFTCSPPSDYILPVARDRLFFLQSGDFEIVAAAFGFEIGRAARKPAKHRQ